MGPKDLTMSTWSTGQGLGFKGLGLGFTDLGLKG